jgi:hypothetical protein
MTALAFELDSEYAGQGSRFVLRLPFAGASGAPH